MSQKKEALFVRKKKNKSGTVSIQIIDKSSGSYRVVKTIGSSENPEQIKELYHQGLELVPKLLGQTSLGFADHADRSFREALKNSIRSHKLVGPELLLGRIFKEIGFNRLDDQLFYHLVISRIVFPSSKLKTVEYLNCYFDTSYDVDRVYRYMDELHSKYRQSLQQISYEHTLQILGGVIAIVFYDVTTIYFEAEKEDELRVTGFSKDGKHQHPQIVLGLLVSSGGYPLA